MLVAGIERFLHGLCEGAFARHLIDPHDRYSAAEFFVEYVRCNRNLYVRWCVI